MRGSGQLDYMAASFWTSQASSAAGARASPIGALKQGLVVVSEPCRGSSIPLPRKFTGLRFSEQKGRESEVRDGFSAPVANRSRTTARVVLTYEDRFPNAWVQA